MGAVILTTEQYNALLTKLEVVATAVEEQKKSPEETFLDNQEFIQLMNISKRTAQTWRDEGIVSFSQIGSKIYYRMKDVDMLLSKNYNKAFKNSRR